MVIQNLFSKSTATGTFWGVIGGLSLIITTIATSNGYLQIVPYFFILCAAMLTTKYVDKSKVSFTSLLKSGFFAFTVSSFSLYAYLLVVVNPSAEITFIGHAWRVGFIVGFGFIVSSIFSFLVKPVK